MRDRGGVWLGAVLVVALAAGFLVWLFVIRDDDDDERTTGAARAGGGPVEMSADDLATLNGKVDDAIYWAGPQEGTKLEVTRSRDKRVYIRYLPEDAVIGSPTVEFLSVGTYPFENGFRALMRASRKEGAIADSTEDGAIVVTNESSPTSVYLAYPDQDLQVEVYDPDPERAFLLATSGAIQPVE